MVNLEVKWEEGKSMDPARQQLPPLTFPLQFSSTLDSRTVLHFFFSSTPKKLQVFLLALAAYPSSLGPLP